MFVNKAWPYGESDPDHEFLALELPHDRAAVRGRERPARQARCRGRPAPERRSRASPPRSSICPASRSRPLRPTTWRRGGRYRSSSTRRCRAARGRSAPRSPLEVSPARRATSRSRRSPAGCSPSRGRSVRVAGPSRSRDPEALDYSRGALPGNVRVPRPRARAAVERAVRGRARGRGRGGARRGRPRAGRGRMTVRFGIVGAGGIARSYLAGVLRVRGRRRSSPSPTSTPMPPRPRSAGTTGRHASTPTSTTCWPTPMSTRSWSARRRTPTPRSRWRRSAPVWRCCARSRSRSASTRPERMVVGRDRRPASRSRWPPSSGSSTPSSRPGGSSDSGALGELIHVENVFASRVDMAQRWNCEPRRQRWRGPHRQRHALGRHRPPFPRADPRGARRRGATDAVARRRGQRAAAAPGGHRCDRDDRPVVELRQRRRQLPPRLRQRGRAAHRMAALGVPDQRRRRVARVRRAGTTRSGACAPRCRNFCAALEGERVAGGQSAADAIASVQVIDAAYRSLTLGDWASVEPARPVQAAGGDVAVTAGRPTTISIHPTAEIEPGVTIGPGTAIWSGVHVRGTGHDDRRLRDRGGAHLHRVRRRRRRPVEDQCRRLPVHRRHARVRCHGRCRRPSSPTTATRVRRPPTSDALRPSEPDEHARPTVVEDGATIGAGSVIGADLTVGRFAMVGMGAVVTRSVAPFHLVVGQPARPVAVVSRAGEPLLRFSGARPPDRDLLTCPVSGLRYATSRRGGRGAGPAVVIRSGRLRRDRRRRACSG